MNNTKYKIIQEELVNNNEIIHIDIDIDRDRRQNLHGYNKSCLGCFNGSFYIFPFPRSMGKKWTLTVLLIELRDQSVSIVL